MTTSVSGCDPETGQWNVLIDGVAAVPYGPGGVYTRLLFTDADLTQIVKVDDGGLVQSLPEWQLWQALDDNDRPFFTPVFDGGSTGQESDWNEHELTWVAAQFMVMDEFEHALPDYNRSLVNRFHFVDEEQHEAWKVVIDLIKKYDLKDMTPRQAKLVDGRPVIHDFGLNPFSPSYDGYSQMVGNLYTAA